MYAKDNETEIFETMTLRLQHLCTRKVIGLSAEAVLNFSAVNGVVIVVEVSFFFLFALILSFKYFHRLICIVLYRDLL